MLVAMLSDNFFILCRKIVRSRTYTLKMEAAYPIEVLLPI
jgi:hypothetical protein